MDNITQKLLTDTPLSILVTNHDGDHGVITFNDTETEAAWAYWDKLKNDKRPMSLNNFGQTLAERNQ